jgi:hypothetical protein
MLMPKREIFQQRSPAMRHGALKPIQPGPTGGGEGIQTGAIGSQPRQSVQKTQNPGAFTGPYRMPTQGPPTGGAAPQQPPMQQPMITPAVGASPVATGVYRGQPTAEDYARRAEQDAAARANPPMWWNQQDPGQRLQTIFQPQPMAQQNAPGAWWNK